MKKTKKVKKTISRKKRVVKKKPTAKKELDKYELMASLRYGGGNMSDRDRDDTIRVLNAIHDMSVNG